jgi:hypothetical protein
MTHDENAKLQAWWNGLSERQRDELLPLEEGHRLPAEHVVGLTHALGVGPAGVKWENEDEYAFRVDRRISDFLETKRDLG